MSINKKIKDYDGCISHNIKDKFVNGEKKTVLTIEVDIQKIRKWKNKSFLKCINEAINFLCVFSGFQTPGEYNYELSLKKGKVDYT
jgi:hypothetical protein